MAEAITAEQALRRLMNGNEKFRSGHYDVHPTMENIRALVAGQYPYAAILACADSRVSPNVIFNCNLGEIFVVRNAGNVVGEYDLGSIEYAVSHLQVPLVMVLGHRNCGAVESVYAWTAEDGALSSAMREILPSVDRARTKASVRNEIISLAEQLNVENSIRRLRESPVLSALPESAIIGAVYDIASGKVSILSGC